MHRSHNSHRGTLADLVFRIPKSKPGWWYRLPQHPTTDSKVDVCCSQMTNGIMPHFGTVFGLTELAMWTVLLEMDLIKKIKENRYGINKRGWEDLKTEFGLQNELELSQFRASGKDGSRNNLTWYIKLGVPVPEYSTPQRIWKHFPNAIQCPPRSLNPRSTLSFVLVEFTKILKSSEYFLQIMTTHSGSVESLNQQILQ